MMFCSARLLAPTPLRLTVIVFAACCAAASGNADAAEGIAETERRVGVARAAGDEAALRPALEQLGRARSAAGNYPEAFVALDEAVRIVATSGTVPAARAELLLLRADAARQGADPAVAEAALREAIDAFDRLGADGAKGRVNARNLLASLFIFRLHARYDEAEELLRAALAIAEPALGAESAPTASVLANLGKVHELRGDNDAAEALMRRALALMERTAGPESRATIICLRTLAYHYLQRGLHHLAEPLNLRIYETEKRLRPDHPATAAAAGELGWLFYTLGDYARGEALLREALALRERTLGGGSLDTAVSLAHLGVLLDSTGRSTEAVPLLRRCLAIRRQLLPEESDGVSGAMSVLGDALGQAGEHAEALALLRRARELRRAVHGPDDPDVAYTQSALARTLAAAGDPAAARREAAEGWRIVAAAREVPAADRLESAWLVAALAVTDGDRSAARDALALAQREYERLFAVTLGFTSESQRLALLGGFAPFDLAATAGDAPALARAVLRFKGIVLDSLLEAEALSAATTNPETGALVEKIRRVRAGASGTSSSRLFDEAETLEKELAARVTAVGARRRALATEPAEVQAALPAGAVLVEFIRFQKIDDRLKSTPAYGALVLAKGRPAAWVPLGEEAVLRPAVERLRLLVQSGGPVEWLEGAHAALMAPVLAVLPGGTERLFISADGLLHGVPWAVLREPQGNFLAGQFILAGVGSGRDLLPHPPAGRPPVSDLVVFAAPDFGVVQGENLEVAAMPVAAAARWRGLSLHDLPGARQEGEAVSRLARGQGRTVATFFGAEASEQQVRTIRTPRILHLATHGFVLPASGEPGGTAPMDLAGLALAGGRQTLEAWRRGERPPAANDGILTAREAASLDLHGTELVVLSACETAGGEPAFGEGVIGLQRGFARAGARNLLLTLWPVADAETAGFMRGFYERLLAGAAPEDALAAVQVETLRRVAADRGPVEAARVAGAFVLTVRR